MNCLICFYNRAKENWLMKNQWLASFFVIFELRNEFSIDLCSKLILHPISNAFLPHCKVGYQFFCFVPIFHTDLLVQLSNKYFQNQRMEFSNLIIPLLNNNLSFFRCISFTFIFCSFSSPLWFHFVSQTNSFMEIH